MHLENDLVLYFLYIISPEVSKRMFDWLMDGLTVFLCLFSHGRLFCRSTCTKSCRQNLKSSKSVYLRWLLLFRWCIDTDITVRFPVFFKSKKTKMQLLVIITGDMMIWWPCFLPSDSFQASGMEYILKQQNAQDRNRRIATWQFRCEFISPDLTLHGDLDIGNLSFAHFLHWDWWNILDWKRMIHFTLLTLLTHGIVIFQSSFDPRLHQPLHCSMMKGANKSDIFFVGNHMCEF